MELPKMKINREIIVISAIILILFILTLWIRVLPLLNLGSTDILNIVGSDDPLYNLRQTEQMLANFPGYGWFEAMTLFPHGQVVHWGPMFIWIISTLCLIAGASTRPEIIGVALWVPPLMAAVMIPVVYYLVRRVTNPATGVIGALLIAVVGGQYFFRSLAGYLDHHIAEVFFGVVFILAYIVTLQYVRSHELDLKKWDTLKIPVILCIITAIAYLAGLFTMPTMILFALIVAIFSIFQYIWDYMENRSSVYLFFINCIIFLVVTIGFFIIGVQTAGLTLAHYSWMHPTSYLLFIGVNALLYGLELGLKGKNKLYYPGAIAALIILGIILLFTAIPDVTGSLTTGIVDFFGQSPYYTTIQEARAWTIEEAWQVFNFGLILMAIGGVVSLYRMWTEKRPEFLLLVVWGAFIGFAAWQHIRYEYYLAANIAILGAIAIGFFLDRAWPDIKAMGKRVAVKEQREEEKPEQKESKGTEKGKKKKSGTEKRAEKRQPKPAARIKVNYVNILVAGLVCAFAVIFVVTSFDIQYSIASSGGVRMNQDWRESLEWMNTGTPGTGVDYYTIYDRETFTYPQQAYGVMSWWDYGHMITYIAKRIPNANPFQSGVSGREGAAAFFISQSEAETNRIADAQGTRYVMTDIEMAVGKFWAMTTWYNASVGPTPYQKIFLVPDDPANPTQFDTVTTYTDAYFMTTIARLHNFDGSLTPAGEVFYIEYTDTLGVGPYPVITNVVPMNGPDALAAADQFNQQAPAGRYADAVSTIIIRPVDTVPALHHYRLVHESPTNIFSGGSADVKYVKVFEYVPGARIKGEGIIEVPVVTNTGRQFTWRAESVNGEFVVPYSTEGTPYAVKASGPYRITGTGREITVSEEAVMSGALIS